MNRKGLRARRVQQSGTVLWGALLSAAALLAAVPSTALAAAPAAGHIDKSKIDRVLSGFIDAQRLVGVSALV
jgi:hypothetical protein